jgi:flavorubredoxin
MLPASLEYVEGGRKIKKFDYSNFQIIQPQDSTVYTLPDGFKISQPVTITIKPVAKDIFLAEGVGGNYRCLVVQLNEGLLVFDAPGTSQVTSQLISEIKTVIPNQPIKYLVASHYHDDHIGGIRSFVAEATAIVTTKKNEPFFRQMISSVHSIEPDALSFSKNDANFLFVEESHKFNYSGGTLEVRNLKENSHTQNIYVVYFPKEKILFQSDLFNFKVTEYTREFLKEINSFNWNIETIISSHGGIIPFKTVVQQLE